MSSLIMQVDLPDGSAVELTGSNCRYWAGTGLPDYEGPIEHLPQGVLEYLLKIQVIKPK